jgi:hypothetical protein
MQTTQKAFSNLKIILCSKPIMAHPRLDRTYDLMVYALTGTDIVEGGMCTILTQIDKHSKFYAVS